MNHLDLDVRRGYPMLMSFKQTGLFSAEIKVIHNLPVETGMTVNFNCRTKDGKPAKFVGVVHSILEHRKAAGAYQEDQRPDFYHIELDGNINEIKPKTPTKQKKIK